MNIKPTISIVLRVLAIVMLVWAFDRHSYAFYQLLRFITFVAAAYAAYVAYSCNKRPWLAILAITALLFNPFAPIRLDRSTWSSIDILAAIVLAVSLFAVREGKPTQKSDQ